MDKNNLEEITKIVTFEILNALSAENIQSPSVQGSYCSVECVDDLCVTTCFNEIGHVISAGAERVSNSFGNLPDDMSVAKFIDHTLLKPEATTEQIRSLCAEAKQYQFASVCVNPTHISLCAELLSGSSVKVCSVIGFPLGANLPETKAFEAQKAIEQGASEVDMVINIGALKDRNLELVARDILGVVNTAHSRNALCKVIIETSLLTEEEKKIACLLSKEAGADFVKTSTGFSTGGATVEDVALMKRTVGPLVGVKASGGVRSFETMEKMVQAGATRIGASAGVRIIQEREKQSTDPDSHQKDSY